VSNFLQKCPILYLTHIAKVPKYFYQSTERTKVSNFLQKCPIFYKSVQFLTKVPNFYKSGGRFATCAFDSASTGICLRNTGLPAFNPRFYMACYRTSFQRAWLQFFERTQARKGLGLLNNARHSRLTTAALATIQVRRYKNYLLDENLVLAKLGSQGRGSTTGRWNPPNHQRNPFMVKAGI
jgi:hypothetical protein